MLKLGLTGSIATGKSTVLDAFAGLGVPVFSSDAAVHELYAGAAVPVVEKLFPGTTGPEGVDRAKLSAALLAAPEASFRPTPPSCSTSSCSKSSKPVGQRFSASGR